MKDVSVRHGCILVLGAESLRNINGGRVDVSPEGPLFRKIRAWGRSAAQARTEIGSCDGTWHRLSRDVRSEAQRLLLSFPLAPEMGRHL